MLEEELEPTCDDSTMIFPAARPFQDIDLGENTMAEVDTVMLAEGHSNIRKEAVDHTNEIVREGLKSEAAVRSDVKDARFDINDRMSNQTRQMDDRFFDIGRDVIDNRQQIAQAIAEIQLVGQNTAKDTEIAVLKNTIEGEKNTRYLSDKIEADGERTRALINDLKYGDLNRELIERNSLLVEERFGRRWYRDQGQFQSQFAALQQQVQAFNSQLQETRQGMVNFGTMAGVGQSSTSNNVR